jgi:hypothetical protein
VILSSIETIRSACCEVIQMEGYTKIANFMGRYPESAQVLRFSDINLQSILYLQAEIYGLREDLRKLESQCNQSTSEDQKNFALDWYTLANAQDTTQWKLVLKLRPLLKQYSTYFRAHTL